MLLTASSIDVYQTTAAAAAAAGQPTLISNRTVNVTRLGYNRRRAFRHDRLLL